MVVSLLSLLAFAFAADRPHVGETRSIPVQWSFDGDSWTTQVRSEGAAAIRVKLDGRWSPVTLGDHAQVRIQSAEPPATLEVAHFYHHKVRVSERSLEACHVSPSGYAQWAQGARSSVYIYFETTENGVKFWSSCSGNVLQDRNQSRLFVLTAYHCIHVKEEADSAMFFLSDVTNINSPSFSGSTILQTVSPSEGDATLLSVNGLTTSRLSYAISTNPEEVPLGALVASVHTPAYQINRFIAIGSRTQPVSGSETGVQVNDWFVPSDYFYKVAETTGLTEQGSSGANLLTGANLASGVLSFGPAPDCRLDNFAYYGRMSTFFPRVQRLLNNSAEGSCIAEINVVNQTLGSSAYANSFQLTIPQSCRWAVAADNEFISVSPRSGSGPATVNYQVLTNGSPGSLSRAGTFSVISEVRRVVHLMQRGTDGNLAYSDVPATHLFAEEINFLNRKYVNAYGCTTPFGFCPEAVVTRGQMAEFIIKAIFGTQFLSVDPTPQFTDVPATHPAYIYVQKMKELRITDGCTATTYCPDDPVTRGQMAVFLVRALQYRNLKDSRAPFTYLSSPYFADTPSSNIFFGPIQKMKEVGITSGCTANAYCGNDSNTRGQMAVFLVRGLFALWEGRSQ